MNKAQLIEVVLEILGRKAIIHRVPPALQDSVPWIRETPHSEYPRPPQLLLNDITTAAILTGISTIGAGMVSATVLSTAALLATLYLLFRRCDYLDADETANMIDEISSVLMPRSRPQDKTLSYSIVDELVGRSSAVRDLPPIQYVSRSHERTSRMFIADKSLSIHVLLELLKKIPVDATPSRKSIMFNWRKIRSVSASRLVANTGVNRQHGEVLCGGRTGGGGSPLLVTPPLEAQSSVRASLSTIQLPAISPMLSKNNDTNEPKDLIHPFAQLIFDEWAKEDAIKKIQRYERGLRQMFRSATPAQQSIPTKAQRQIPTDTPLGGGCGTVSQNLLAKRQKK